jgi:hypothetical protein
MSRHTWRVENKPGSLFFSVVADGGRIVAARIRNRDEAYRLAAAPELLEVLRALCADMRDEETRVEFLYHMQERARALLARVDGGES